MSRLKWGYRKYIKFLECYKFKHGHAEGSHLHYNGRIYGLDRVVQVIFSNREKDCQSIKTIKMGMKHSGIPKKYYEEWNRSGIVHEEIIY